jgi:DNA-binding CsgD family transcriptional regulator
MPVKKASKAPTKKHPKTPRSKASVRREIIAEKVIEGKSNQEIAADLEMSKDGVKSARKHPETITRIQELFSELTDKIKENNSKMVDAIGRGLDATKYDGEAQDHDVQQRAVANQIRLLQALQPKSSDIPIVATVTLEELDQMIAEREAANG